MPRTNDEPTTRVHLHLYTSDLVFIRTAFGGAGNIDQSAAIREIVRRMVKHLRSVADQTAQPVHVDEGVLGTDAMKETEHG